jgi:hypothetical protein
MGPFGIAPDLVLYGARNGFIPRLALLEPTLELGGNDAIERRLLRSVALVPSGGLDARRLPECRCGQSATTRGAAPDRPLQENESRRREGQNERSDARDRLKRTTRQAEARPSV